MMTYLAGKKGMGALSRFFLKPKLKELSGVHLRAEMGIDQQETEDAVKRGSCPGALKHVEQQKRGNLEVDRRDRVGRNKML